MADFLRDGRCPRCQSDLIYKRESDAGILFRQSDVMMHFYLCSQCGYLESYLHDPAAARPGWDLLSGAVPVIAPATSPAIAVPSPELPETASVEEMTPDERRYHEMLMGTVSNTPPSMEQLAEPAPSSNPFDLNAEDQAHYDSLFGAPLSPELNDMMETRENPRIHAPEPEPEPEIEPPYAEENIPEHLRDFLLPTAQEQRIHSEGMQSHSGAKSDDDNTYQRLLDDRHHDNKTLFQRNSDTSQH